MQIITATFFARIYKCIGQTARRGVCRARFGIFVDTTFAFFSNGRACFWQQPKPLLSIFRVQRKYILFATRRWVVGFGLQPHRVHRARAHGNRTP